MPYQPAAFLPKLCRLFLTACFALSLSIPGIAQNCNCETNFQWVKKTFEENDAGFQYDLNLKGKAAYEATTRQILEKVKGEKDFEKCRALMIEWLSFFRVGHFSIRVSDEQRRNIDRQRNDMIDPVKAVQTFPGWPLVSIDTTQFANYIKGKKDLDYEGIWQTGAYRIGIKKDGDGYTGFIIRSEAPTWTNGQVKLKISRNGATINSIFYMRDHSAVESGSVELIGNNHLQIGEMLLERTDRRPEKDPMLATYYKCVEAPTPFLDRLTENTLLLRIPSFQVDAKKSIDSVLAINRKLILSTENLIIDMTNGTGGSDESYEQLLPILYTNPIRTVGLQYYSTKLNNQRMLDFISKPEYQFTDEQKGWAKKSYDKLEQHLGQWVSLDSVNVDIQRFDTIYPYPKNIAILINHGNGSTDEQFLLAAKQSRKVKLFGATTFGELDISNMYYIPSPCNEFSFGYCLTKSFRIPGMAIDGKGIQPDYFIDAGIPTYKWIGFVKEVLAGR